MEKKSFWWVPPINRCRHIVISIFFPACFFLAAHTLHAQNREEMLRPYVQPAVFALSKVMMHDVVSPVIASRYYMYCTLGAYSIIASNDKKYIHPGILIPHFPKEVGNHILQDPSLAALFCIYETGMSILPSGMDMLREYDEVKIKAKKIGYTEKEIIESAALAASVSKEIVQYAKQDGYFKLSAYPKYRPKRKDGFWFPTPPAYMDAVDPYWRTMRTMIIDSANQFPSAPATIFDTSLNSTFSKLTQEVYQIGKSPTSTQREIAGFWDCNPFVVATSGHMSLGFKKISPGGHWMNIAANVALQENIPYRKMIQILSLESLTLYDAFIVCWNEKYKTDRARPETIINKFIDIKWQPILQTPPFPEYTSGHSVISSASAEILSFLMGENISFTDDSEVIFELAPRKFHSFREAANEASISRLYGGIHFRDAIENGQEQGKKVGIYFIEKLKKAGFQR